MDYIQAIILSIIEGVSEFLPISSTGHLILASQILKIPQTEFVKSFEIIIQLGAILAVVFLYWRKLLVNTAIWKNVLAAFIPTAVVGFGLYKVIKEFLIGNTMVTLWALFLGGLVLIFLELIYNASHQRSDVIASDYKEKEHHAGKIEDLTWKQSAMIGLIQSLSVIPGVSRSGASIMGALFLGAKRKVAVEFSFLLAVPTIAAATGLDLLKTNFSFSAQELGLLAVGFIGSFIVALLVVKWFLKFIQKNNFIPFGIYRIILAILFWLIVIRS